MKTNDLPCFVVNDLLPLYIDGLLSSETKEAVHAHLEHCKRCSDSCAAMAAPSQPCGEALPAQDAKGRNFLKKAKRKMLQNILVAALVFSALFYVVTFWQQPFHFQVRNLCQLSNGSIYFELVPSEAESIINGISYSDGVSSDQTRYEIHMGYSLSTLWQCSLSGSRAGRVYCFTFSPAPDPNGSSFLPFYYAQGNHRLLIWDGAQELPPASPEIEEKAQTILNPFSVSYDTAF